MAQYLAGQMTPLPDAIEDKKEHVTSSLDVQNPCRFMLSYIFPTSIICHKLITPSQQTRLTNGEICKGISKEKPL